MRLTALLPPPPTPTTLIRAPVRISASIERQPQRSSPRRRLCVEDQPFPVLLPRPRAESIDQKNSLKSVRRRPAIRPNAPPPTARARARPPDCGGRTSPARPPSQTTGCSRDPPGRPHQPGCRAGPAGRKSARRSPRAPRASRRRRSARFPSSATSRTRRAGSRPRAGGRPLRPAAAGSRTESAAPSRAACGPPTLATSMVSSSSTMADSAQPQRRLIFSASGIGVRSPTAMSLVKWSPADGDDASVPQAAALEDSEIRGSAANIHERDAELLLILRQHRLSGRQLLEHGIEHRDARTVHARDDVLRRRRAAGHDVDVDLEPGAGHARPARRCRPARRPRSPAAARAGSRVRSAAPRPWRRRWRAARPPA